MRETKFCKVCNTDTEHYEAGGCVVCTRARASAWKKNNRERSRKANKAWADKNRAKANAMSKASREKSKDKYLAREAAYRLANRERLAETARELRRSDIENARRKDAEKYARNPAKAKAAARRWQINNPDKTRQIWHNRQARKKANGGALSHGIIEKLRLLQRGKCACCGKPLGNDFHLDHIIPLALGGANADSNVQLLASTCNLKKGAKHPIEFMQSKGFLL